MATPVVESVGTSNDVSPVTSHTVTMPSGVVSGDLLIAFVTVDGTSSIDTFTGWTELYNGLSGTSVRCAGYYRVSDGTEGATETFTTAFSEQSSHITVRISGYTGNPEAGVLATGNDTAPNPPFVNPAFSGSNDFLFIAIAQYNDGTVTVSGYPTGYNDNQTSSRANDAAGTGTAIATKSTVGVGSDDPGTYTLSSAERWGAQTVAITPDGSLPPISYYHLRFHL